MGLKFRGGPDDGRRDRGSALVLAIVLGFAIYALLREQAELR